MISKSKLFRIWQAAISNNRANSQYKMKWNESGFRPPLCTYRLNWARRTSWGWWDDWDDTVLQTQNSKFEPWRSEAEHATSRSRRLPTILTFTRGWGRNISVSFKPPRPGTEPRALAWRAAVLTTTLGPPPNSQYNVSLLSQCWASVVDGGPTLSQQWLAVVITVNWHQQTYSDRFSSICNRNISNGIVSVTCTAETLMTAFVFLRLKHSNWS